MTKSWPIAASMIALSGLAFAHRNAAAGPEETPLIDREVLFGNPERAGVQLSPDGARLSFLAPVSGVLNVWVGPADDFTKARPVTKDSQRGIRQYFWAFNNSHIIYLQDKGGDENWRAYSVALDSNLETDLTPFNKVRADIQAANWKFPDEILVALNDRDPQFHDIYRINIKTGDRTLVQRNDGFSAFVTDADFKPRLASRYTPDGGTEILTIAEDGATAPFQTISMEDSLTTAPASFDKTGKSLYLLDSRGRDTAAMTIVTLDGTGTGASNVLAEDPRADAGATLTHPRDDSLQAVSFTYDRQRWKILDEAIAADFAYLRTVADGDFNVPSRTLDDTKWIVSFVIDNGPVRYFLYDRPAKKARFLFTNRPALEKLTLARMRPRIIKARDGLDLVSYYTLPVWADSDGDGKPEHPLPMVLFVHGGPWARDSWGFNPYHQWLANRGYAVLSVNYRGSTGFGKAFINAGNMEWAGKMHNDLLDSVNWAVSEGIADPNQVAIMGGSYGGYATLVGLTFSPDEFACGVDIVGPSNITTLLNSIPPYWVPTIELFKKRVGDHTTENGRKFLDQRSPLSRVSQIKRPLLIGQGANDPRVKQSESDQIVAAMKARNIPVTYVLFPDEGHGFARPDNNKAFNAVAEAFLAQHLGGRYQPIKDLHGSSIQVPQGADAIPGLSDALTTMNQIPRSQ